MFWKIQKSQKNQTIFPIWNINWSYRIVCYRLFSYFILIYFLSNEWWAGISTQCFSLPFKFVVIIKKYYDEVHLASPFTKKMFILSAGTNWSGLCKKIANKMLFTQNENSISFKLCTKLYSCTFNTMNRIEYPQNVLHLIESNCRHLPS